jgi:hypothetical protein
MDINAFKSRALQYYLFENMPDNVVSDWLRYVATDGSNCREVEYDYQPQAHEMVFFCNIRNGETEVTLYKNGGEEAK